MSETTTRKLIASCSFCGKPNTDVKKLIAGPGIFICDECVGLCEDIIKTELSADEAEAAAAAYENRPLSEVLDLLPALAKSVVSVEACLSGWVIRLRSGGTSWATIGERLDMTAEAAASRFDASSKQSAAGSSAAAHSVRMTPPE